MRAAILRWYGAPPEAGEFDEPESANGSVVVDVVAAGLNPVDIRIASGTFYGGSPPLPRVAGGGGVGRTPPGALVYFDPPPPPHGPLAPRAPVHAAPAPPLGGAA